MKRKLWLSLICLGSPGPVEGCHFSMLLRRQFHCTEETVLKLSLHPGQGPGQHVATYTMLWKGITHIAPLKEHCPQTRNESILFTGAGAYGCRKTWLSQANSLKCAAHNIFSFKYSCVHVPTVMRALQLLLPSETMFKTAFTQSSH